jgi:hypothetical protein
VDFNRVGIDWVAFGIFLAGYVIGQIRAIPLAVRYVALALSMMGIAGWRLRMGAAGINLAFVVIAAALGVFYLFKAIQAQNRRPRE